MTGEQSVRRASGNSLFAVTDASTLAGFRILFGGMMSVDALIHWVHRDWFFPDWEFRPLPVGLEFLEPLPNLPAGVLLVVAAAAAALVSLGCATRIAALVFAGAHAALYLWDPTQFNNHNYLFVLLACWIGVLGLDSMWSVDAWRGVRPRSDTVPWWHLGIFLFHLGLVYTFGAINKLNTDWLQGEPLSIWLGVERERPWIGPWLAHPAAKYVFAYGGLLFDAVITPALCWRRTRWPAIAATVLFHWTNSWMFLIGPFPWVMIGANVLFLEPETPRRWWHWIGARWGRRSELRPPLAGPVRDGELPTRWGWVVGSVGVYCLLHIVVPFRSYLFAGNVEWTEEAKNYSWRMMLSHKDTFLGVMVMDLASGEVWEPDPREYLSRRQMRGKGVWGSPRLMAAYARFLRRRAVERGFQDPFVKVDAVASLNGRPYQYLINPDVDLSAAALPWWKTPDWIVPLQKNQPIGDYRFVDPEVKFAQVMQVIESHRRQWKQSAATPTMPQGG